MRAKFLELVSPFNVVLRESAVTKREIIAKTILSAISPGTELSAYRGEESLQNKPPEFPRLLGYCNLSKIIKVNSSNLPFKVGDKILTFQSHRDIVSVNSDEIISLVPKGISDYDAVCTYLFHLGYSGILNLNIVTGSNVMIIGGGCLGVASAAMNAIASNSVTLVSDLPNSSFDVITKNLNIKVISRKAILKKIFKEKFETVISTTNSFNDLHDSLQCLKMHGSIGILGFPGRGQNSFNVNPFVSNNFYRKQLNYQAIGMLPEKNDTRGFLNFNEKKNFIYILDLMKQKKLSHKIFNTNTYSFKNISKCYADLESRKSPSKTHIIKW